MSSQQGSSAPTGSSHISPSLGPFTAGGSATSTHSPLRRVPGSPLSLLPRPATFAQPKQPVDANDVALQLQRIEVAFRHWDCDGDGLISVSDVGAVLNEAHVPAAPESLIALMDVNSDGKVSFDEFRRASEHKLKRDRFQPPEDLITEMVQDLGRKRPHEAPHENS